MHRSLFLLLLAIATLGPAPAWAQDARYRAPRTDDGQPDLQGVWNFGSGVPLQRPAAFSDKKFFTKEEHDRQVAAMRNGLAAIAKFAPVEAVGLELGDG